MKSICLFIFLLSGYLGNASPVHELLDRIDPGASKKFKIELVEGNTDFFELDQDGDRNSFVLERYESKITCCFTSCRKKGTPGNIVEVPV